MVDVCTPALSSLINDALVVHLCNTQQPCFAKSQNYQDSSDNADVEDEHNHEMKTACMGHATFLVEPPFMASLLRGAKVLFDLVFDDKCWPSNFLCPNMFSDPRCKIENIPYVDAVATLVTSQLSD